MKKNFSVNIGSRIFHIDEDVYERLNNYLGRLRTFFASDEGCDEIITDIEMRIAELLEEKKTSGPAIITLQHIEDVIANMGEPDEMSGTKRETKTEKTSGKLFRDPDNRQIGGVCAGIAAWLGVAPLWVRIALIVFTVFYGFGIILYLILWLILPEAKTTSEKLEMKRQIINIDTLRDEVASAGTGLKNTGNSVMHGLGKFLRLCTEIISRLVVFVLQLLRQFAGVLLLFIVIVLFAGVGMIFLVREPMEFGMYHLGPSTLSHAFEWVVPGTALRWQAIIALTLLFIGFVGIMVFAGLRLLLKWPPLRWIVISILVIFMIAGLLLGGGFIYQYSRTTSEIASASNRQIIALDNNQIQLVLGSSDRAQYWAPLSQTDKPGCITDVLGNINLSVRPSPNDSIIITTIKTASAVFETEAANYIRNIKYTFNFKDSTLTIHPYFSFPLKDGMHYQKAEVIIGIPVNTRVEINDEMYDFINYSDFVGETNNGGIYLMTNSGLQYLKKEIRTSSDSI
jgi:phage shock protein PspC (stress-responsive transcriptional regulator)